MKRKFTIREIAVAEKTNLLTLAGILFFISVLLIGCYQFRSINQPSAGYTNSYFDVPIVAERDNDPGLTEADWANTLRNIGLFGVMIPDGWTVDDSIEYTIISKNPLLSNTGFLVHNDAHTQTLQDTIPALPGYHWWGAITDRTAELTSLDSLYFTPRIKTNNQAGTFFLRYAIGDKDYWDRNPADQYNYGGGLSDPIEIVITYGVGTEELLSKANVTMYPNPTEGTLHVNLSGYKSEVIAMTVLNSAGAIVKKGEIFSSSSTFNLSDLPKGLYFVELRNGIHKSRTKILLR
ncbi:MAG: T9SS type A sorting domain-containing protein [Bacteroidota bacterium]